MASPYIERILKAHVYEVAVESPLEQAGRLSRRLNNQVLLKREDLQSVFPSSCAAPTTALQAFRLKTAAVLFVHRRAIMRRAWRLRRSAVEFQRSL